MDNIRLQNISGTKNNSVLNLFCLLILSIVIFYIFRSADLHHNIQLCCGIIITIGLIYWKKIGKYNIAYSLYLLSFVFFHWGLLLLSSFNKDASNFYIDLFPIKTLNQVVEFQFLCVMALFFSSLFSPYIRPFKYNIVNRLPEDYIKSYCKIGFVISLTVEIFLLILKWRVFMNTGMDGYESVRKFEGTIPTPLYLIEYMFIPFAFLSIIYNKQNKFYKIVIIVWSLITALMGDRTSGIAGIITIMIIDLYFGGKLNYRKYLFLFIGFIVVICLISFIRYYRIGESADSINNPLFEVMSELGFNFVPVAFTILYFPLRFGYQYGDTYIYSTISAIIPKGIDLLGISDMAYKIGYSSADVIQKISGFDFGIGYSLCAESYANFGMFGFIMIFIEGLIIIKLFKFRNNNLFSKYVCIVLLYQFFTLPRRHFYNLVNNIFWSIFIIIILLYLYIYVLKFLKKHDY